MTGGGAKSGDPATWLARIAVAAVFVLNLECALAFLVHPEAYTGAFELAGLSGEVAIRGLGVAFLMWNTTYPLVIWRPRKYVVLYGVVLAQQVIGLAGESWLLLTIPRGHEALAEGITRFAIFDGCALLVMVMTFGLLLRAARRG